MFKYQIPTWLQRFYSGVTWRKNIDEKAIYLTFDDGCVPEVTPKVLTILDHYQVKATFFCVGDNVRKYPELYTELLLRGHQTGNHTFNHLRGTKTPVNEYVNNVQQAAKLIDSRLFRPPYGRISWCEKRLLARQFEIILWDVLTNDFDHNISQDEILKNIQKYSRNGSIVVFHDSLKAAQNMLAVLPKAIEWWQQKGFKFNTL